MLFFIWSTKKSPFLTILTWFLILGKIQDCNQDGNHCWWRHRPPAAPPPIKYTSSCREDERLSTKGKISLQNTATYQKLWGWVPSTQSPPPPLYHGGGMNLLVRPRVNIISYIHIIIKCNETIKNTTLIASKIIIKKMDKVHFYFIYWVLRQIWIIGKT